MDSRRLIIANGVTVDLSEYLLKSEAETLYATLDGLNNKQDKLISGTNIKTVNGTSILGGGDITISGGNSDANVQAVDTGDVIDDVTVNYATTSYVDGLVGDINSVLESIINGGGSGVQLITFTIAGTEYQAEEGMTWEEWCNSEYNTDDFSAIGNNVLNFAGSALVGFEGILETKTATIIDSSTYILIPDN
jgi:hypothetical protein